MALNVIFLKFYLGVFSFAKVLSFVDSEIGDKQEQALSLVKLRSYLRYFNSFYFIKFKCLELALASRLFLNKRGQASSLYFGVKKEGTELKAHAWLKVGDFFVTGEEGHEQFKVLATFD